MSPRVRLGHEILISHISQEYDPIHPPDAISTNLPVEKQYVSLRKNGHISPPLSLGPVEPDTVEKVEIIITDEEKARLERVSNRPPLSEVLNLHDFEVFQILFPAAPYLYI